MPEVTSTASSAEVPKLGFEPSSIGCTKTASLHPEVPEMVSIRYDSSSSNLTVVTRYFVRTNLSQNFIFSPSYKINNGGVSADGMYSLVFKNRRQITISDNFVTSSRAVVYQNAMMEWICINREPAKLESKQALIHSFQTLSVISEESVEE